MPLSLALALQVATTIGADGRLAPLKLLPGCGRERDDDVVVCASRADRFRLPLPEERASPEAADHRAMTGMAALTPATRCGIFDGERRCSKREAEGYGYGRGRDPITVLSRLGAALLDPDADVAGPPDAP
jgi:hypothetical protein